MQNNILLQFCKNSLVFVFALREWWCSKDKKLTIENILEAMKATRKHLANKFRSNNNLQANSPARKGRTDPTKNAMETASAVFLNNYVQKLAIAIGDFIPPCNGTPNIHTQN